MRRLLTPVALAVGAAALLRRRGYDLGWRKRFRAAVPVISVGGLSLGGSGKTPVALHIARLLGQRWGVRVGVVHSGYGGRAGKRVLRVDPSGDGAGLWYGDEPVFLARRLEEALVVRGPDKVAAASLCVDAGAQVIVVDDGFQHLRLSRDLDIVVRSRPPELPIPAGNGREFSLVAAGVDVRWWHERGGEHSALRGKDAHVVSTLVPDALVSPDGEQIATVGELAGARVFLVAGIAQPSAFWQLAVRCGAKIVGSCFVRDHRALTVELLQRRCAAGGADLILCTEKDAARSPAALRAVGARALRCDTQLLRGHDLLEALLAECLRARGKRQAAAERQRMS